MQSPAQAGDAGKRLMSDQKAAIMSALTRPEGTRWTETTAPTMVEYVADDIITRSELVAYVAENGGGGGGSTPDATTSTKGKAVILGGTAAAPTVPATALTGTIDDARIPSGITRDSELASAVSGIVAGAPGALDTLDELAAAFGDDPTAIATITAALAVRLRVDAAQSLTTGQKLQARQNIAAARVLVDGAEVDTYDVSTAAVTPGDIGAQPADPDLTAIAALTATTDNFMQAKAGAWASRTLAQVKTDLGVVAAAVAGPWGNNLWAVGGCDNHERSNAGGYPGGGTAILSEFTAPVANTITKLGSVVGDVAGTSITLVRHALYTVDGAGNKTMVARTASTPTHGATANAAASFALSTVGGYPASYTFIPGQRYAIGLLCVGSNIGNFHGRYTGNGVGLTPVLATGFGGQSDLAASYGAGTPWFFSPYVYGQP
jgi:hypothetical protein